MRRPRRRPVYYSATSLNDGTVLTAYPMRKPAPKVMKRDHLKIDMEGVCKEWLRPGWELSDVNYDTRFRFQNILATNLNTRRAIRELVLPVLTDIRQEIAGLRAQLDSIDSRSPTRDSSADPASEAP